MIQRETSQPFARDSHRLIVRGEFLAAKSGGDSRHCRYHLLRLHPLSVSELRLTSSAELKDLLTPSSTVCRFI